MLHFRPDEFHRSFCCISSNGLAETTRLATAEIVSQFNERAEGCVRQGPHQKHPFLGASTTHVSTPNYQTFTIHACLGFVGSHGDPWYRSDFVAVLAMYQKVRPRSKLKTISARQTRARCVSKEFL
jgi:hypothetical protein